MHATRVWAMLIPVALVAAAAQDIVSGPERGAPVPKLPVFAATGPHEGKDVDYAAQRQDKPTVYLFIQADKFDRPMARFLRDLDEKLRGDEHARAVGVWLTDDAAKTRDHLPRVQGSLKLEATAFTCYDGERVGPKGWNINTDAHLTAVVAAGKVAANFGFQSINETNVPEIHKALLKASAGK
jgi:hypothetical protein